MKESLIIALLPDGSAAGGEALTSAADGATTHR